MKERPIIFNAEMIRALLDGRKTMTRRILNHKNLGGECGPESMCAPSWCPFGHPGDRLWVRETFRIHGTGPKIEGKRVDGKICYKSTSFDEINDHLIWTPSIHMPRWASRITLEITNVRVERVNDISEEDASLDGGFKDYYEQRPYHVSFKGQFKSLWESINGPGSWQKNPFVWVVEFKRV